MAPKRVEVGIVLDPRPVQIVGEWDKALEQIQSTLRFAEVRVVAGCVVESKKIVGVDGEGSREPFSGTFSFANSEEASSTECRWSGVFRMQGKLLFCQRKAFARRALDFIRPTERAIDVN